MSEADRISLADEKYRADMREGSAKLLAALQGRRWEKRTTYRNRKIRRVRDFILIDLPSPKEPLSENPFKEVHRLSFAVADTVADAFGLTGEQLRGHCRERRLVYPRAIVSRLLSDWGLPYAEIGRRLGGRDHSTVIHAVKNTFPNAMRDRGSKAVYQHLRHLMAKAIVDIEASE